jgi:hypothetical protein
MKCFNKKITTCIRPARFVWTLCIASVLTAGCAAPGFFAPFHGVEPNAGWLELQDSRFTTVSPGVLLEMPEGPYRARFADANGIYYQASRPLVYRPQFGGATALTGGLYVPQGQAHQARAWTEPVLPSPILAYPNTFVVKLHDAN